MTHGGNSSLTGMRTVTDAKGTHARFFCEPVWLSEHLLVRIDLLRGAQHCHHKPGSMLGSAALCTREAIWVTSPNTVALFPLAFGHHHRLTMYADARGELGSSSLCQLLVQTEHRIENRQSGQHSALWIILVGLRITEENQ
jgi:hypothetical protein